MSEAPLTIDPNEEFGDRAVPCPECGYDLRHTTTLVCPECGRVCAIAELRTNPERARPKRQRRTDFRRNAALIIGSVVSAPGMLFLNGIWSTIAGGVLAVTVTAQIAIAIRPAVESPSRALEQAGLRRHRRKPGAIRDEVRATLKRLSKKRTMVMTRRIATGTVRNADVRVIFLAFPLNASHESHDWTLSATRCPADWPERVIGTTRKHLSWAQPPVSPESTLPSDACDMLAATKVEEYWIIADGWLACLRCGAPLASEIEQLVHRPVELRRLLSLSGWPPVYPADEPDAEKER